MAPVGYTHSHCRAWKHCGKSEHSRLETVILRKGSVQCWVSEHFLYLLLKIAVPKLCKEHGSCWAHAFLVESGIFVNSWLPSL